MFPILKGGRQLKFLGHRLHAQLTLNIPHKSLLNSRMRQDKYHMRKERDPEVHCEEY